MLAPCAAAGVNASSEPLGRAPICACTAWYANGAANVSDTGPPCGTAAGLRTQPAPFDNSGAGHASPRAKSNDTSVTSASAKLHDCSTAAAPPAPSASTRYEPDSLGDVVDGAQLPTGGRN